MPYTIAIDARKVRDFGIGTYIRNLVGAIVALDTEDRFVLLVGPRGKEAFGGLPPHVELVLERSPVYSAREIAKLSWRLASLGADLYHATHYVLPAYVPGRAVVTIHDIIHLLYPEFLPSKLAFLYAQRMIRHSLSRGDRIITVSHNTRDDVLRHFDVDASKVEVVYNGVEEVFHEPVPEADLERWLGGLGIARPYLLFVGNPKPHKNLDNVIQAYAQARALHAFEAPLVVVGDRGRGEFKLRQRAEQLGVGAHIHYLGHVAQEALPAVYQGATLFLYPTLYEGFGLPVVEAMASGIPVVTSDTSALKEVAGECALLVDPLNVALMARAIARLMREPEERERLAARGRERAREFSWERAGRRTLEIYRKALESGRREG